MRKLKTIIIVVAVLILIGLLELLNIAITGPMSNPITGKELIGEYETQLPDGGKEVLTLFPEGICKHDIFLKDGRTYHATGKWQHDEIHTKFGSSDYLNLEGTMDSLSEFGDKINPNIEDIPQGASAGLPVERTLMGHIKISLYGDQGIYYRKIEK